MSKIFDWQEFHWLARELFSQADGSSHTEVMFRTAVSRAYYAAFHRACEYLEEVNEYPTRQEFEGNRKETHRFLISMFLNNPDHPERRKIGRMLHYLKGFRHQADYVRSVERHVFRKKDEVEALIDKAEKAIDLIDSL